MVFQKIRLKKTLAIIIAAVIAAVSVAAILSLYFKSANAFEVEKSDNIQVAITQSFKPLDTLPSFDMIPEGDNAFTEETASDETDAVVEEREFATLKKDNGVIYEKGNGGEAYYYSRDGKDYVLYYDDLFGMNADNGVWTELEAEKTSMAPAFDFNVLTAFSKKDFKKNGDYYIPVNEDIYFDILQIGKSTDYSDYHLKIYLEDNRVTKIEAEFIYNKTISFVQKYNFTYNDEAVTVPKAEKLGE